MKQYNEKLLSWQNVEPGKTAGFNNIQIPGNSDLLVWQNRYREPTLYEQDLVEALISAFRSGLTDLSGIIDHLNKQGVYQESGKYWTKKDFEEEMQKLGY